MSGNFFLVVQGIAAAIVDNWKNRSCSIHISSKVPGDTGLFSYFMYQKGRILEFLPLLQRQELQLNYFLLGTLVHHAVSELLMCHGLWKRGSSLLDLVFLW